MKDVLPDKLSELIIVAVKDARKLDRNKYCPSFINFHDPDEVHPSLPRYCLICDAGAVMAGTLQVDFTQSAIPDCFPDIEHKLIALDRARCGNYASALRYLGVERDWSFTKDIKVSPFHDYYDWETFDKHLNHMEGVAKQLKDLGY